MGRGSSLQDWKRAYDFRNDLLDKATCPHFVLGSSTPPGMGLPLGLYTLQGKNTRLGICHSDGAQGHFHRYQPGISDMTVEGWVEGRSC